MSTTPDAGGHAGAPGLAGTGAGEDDLAPGAADVVLNREQLRISTQRVDVERVRFSKRIVTTTRTLEVPVRVEQLVITHEPLPGHRRGTPRDVAGDRDLVITLHEEVPEVTLRVVAVERVRVGKRDVTGEQTLTVELAAEAAEITAPDTTT